MLSGQTQADFAPRRTRASVDQPPHFPGVSDSQCQVSQRLVAPEQALGRVHRRAVLVGGREPDGTPAAAAVQLGRARVRRGPVQRAGDAADAHQARPCALAQGVFAQLLPPAQHERMLEHEHAGEHVELGLGDVAAQAA